MKGMTLHGKPTAGFIDEPAIQRALETAARNSSASCAREVIRRGLQMKGLGLDDVATLMSIQDPDMLNELFLAAREVKNTIYGNRLVLFAPLYVSNLCQNECHYCAFRVRNKAIRRRTLSQEEIAAETRALIDQGHKRVLMVAGEAYPEGQGFDYILRSIETVYGVRSNRGEIRRINVNIAPLDVDEFRQLAGAKIGTYQIFQETYHRATYASVHTAGPKSDFDWRLLAPNRAMQAGINDLGVGVLFGLHDWRFEMLALQQHIHHLEKTYGVGPHTISVPRLEPAAGSPLADRPPHPVTDADFLKIVAILRLAVPYTGIIMSTREHPAIRRASFELGVSQISAGSRCDPGGYADSPAEKADARQFQLGDHRTLDEVVRDVAEHGYTPSFCTACYRMGRTGADFMDLAKPGLIRKHCAPNALSSCLEYLIDYASPSTRAAGEQQVDRELDLLEKPVANIARQLVERVKNEERDVFV